MLLLKIATLFSEKIARILAIFWAFCDYFNINWQE
jgi:hypothetical protein